MTTHLSIYLAGSIVKGTTTDEKNQQFWGNTEIQLLQEALAPITVSFLNPAERSDDLADPQSTMGRDILQVYLANVVIVDAHEKRGLGVGAEMMFADQIATPIISIAPEKSHYRRTNFELLGQFLPNYTHPFLGGLSDVIVQDYQEAAQWIKKTLVLQNDSVSAKEHRLSHKALSAIQYYIATQFKTDKPMQELMQNPNLFKRMQKLKSMDINKNSFWQDKRYLAPAITAGTIATAIAAYCTFSA